MSQVEALKARFGMTSEGKWSNHFSGGMLYRYNPSLGVPEFLVIHYKEKGRSGGQYKFPGGGSRESKVPLVYRSEAPIDTLRREWKTEVGQEVTGAYGFPHIVKYEDPVTGFHYKNFFLLDLSMVVGQMRNVVMEESEPGSKTEVLGVPTWVSVTDLIQTPQFSMSRDHHAALQVAIETIKGLIENDLVCKLL